MSYGRHWGLSLTSLLLPILASAQRDARPEGFALPHATCERPNIVLILADDLGFSDIAPFGSEIATPHLDSLAATGRLMTSLYATSMPISRAEVLTGADHHLVGVGSLEPARRNQIGHKAYQGQSWSTTYATVMAACCMPGCWARDRGMAPSVSLGSRILRAHTRA